MFRNLSLVFLLVLQGRSSVVVHAGKKKARGFQSFRKKKTGFTDVLQEMSSSFEDAVKSRSFANVILEDCLVLMRVVDFQMTDGLC